MKPSCLFESFPAAPTPLLKSTESTQHFLVRRNMGPGVAQSSNSAISMFNCDGQGVEKGEGGGRTVFSN